MAILAWTWAGIARGMSGVCQDLTTFMLKWVKHLPLNRHFNGRRLNRKVEEASLMYAPIPLRFRVILCATVVLAISSCKNSHAASGSIVKSDSAAPGVNETLVNMWLPIVDDAHGFITTVQTFGDTNRVCTAPKIDTSPANWRMPTLAELSYIQGHSPDYLTTFANVPGVWLADTSGLGSQAANSESPHSALVPVQAGGQPQVASDTDKYGGLCVPDGN